MKTQKQTIEKHLRKHKNITSWDAITKYKITRLSHYILLLRAEGWNIETEYKSKNGVKFGKYKLV